MTNKMPERLVNIPTNLVMGFLGVGKTTAILDLLKQKPKNEVWAVLVNEFGKVGIDGAIFKVAGATVKEIAGGCLCCAVGLPFQTGLNRLLKEVRPDRVLIEPTGLGHPKKVLAMLDENSHFKGVLDLRASICLVDPAKLKDSRYTNHESFVDQIALADVLVANKIDLADREAIDLFHQWAENSSPKKALIAQTRQGQLDIAWLDLFRDSHRNALFPESHSRTESSAGLINQQRREQEKGNYQSFGCVFPVRTIFDYDKLSHQLSRLRYTRVKGVFNTDKGWFIFNGIDGEIRHESCLPLVSSRIEVIARDRKIQGVADALSRCVIETTGV